MDPAAFTPPTELRRLITDSASKLINLWPKHEGEAFLYAVEDKLQQLISGYPWLLDSLHPLVQNFVLHELHLHPPAATARPLALMAPSPRRKRRSHRRRGTPQPDVGTCKQSAVVSERDTFSAASDSVTVFSGAIFCVSSEDNNDFSVSPMATAPKTAFSEPTFCVNDCVHAVVSKPGVPESSTMNIGNLSVREVFSSPSVHSGEVVNLTETVLPDHVLPSTLSPRSNVGSVTQLAVQLSVQSAAQLPSVQSAAQLPSVQSAAQLPSVQSAAQLPSVQSATPPPVTTSLPVAQLPPVQQPTHPFIQSPSSPSRYEQGTHFIITSAGSLKLATSETFTPSRASPEAGCRSPADSGPLEVKTPAPAVSSGNSPEHSRLSVTPVSSSEFTRPPPSSAECIGEHFQPPEDCIPLLLPESSHCAAQSQPVSTLAEVSVPAASVSVSTGGPEEPVQSQAMLAGGSGEPSQRPASSAGWPDEPILPQVSSAGGSGEPSQPQVLSASAPPSSGPASAPPSSGPASAPPSSGPASSTSGPASSGPAVATPSWDPARPVPPRLCGPLSRPLSWHHGRRGWPPDRVRHHRWHHGRPPELFARRCHRCRVHGQPPELFARRRRCRVHGRPPELFARRRRRHVHGRPPELFARRRRRHVHGRPPELFARCRRVHGRPPELFARCRPCRVHGRPPDLFWLLCCRPPQLFMDSC
ncbi:hypothetical protein ACER0C_001659 [Sarotherodon galilaeus]